MFSRVVIVATLFLGSCSLFAQSQTGSKTNPKGGTKPGSQAGTKPKPASSAPEKPGPLIYPEGRWKGLHTYNTPFEGIDADYGASSAMVLKVTDVDGITAGSKITHYRLSEDGDFVEASDWKSLLEAVKEGDGEHLWVKGVDRAKHSFTVALSLISDDNWTAPDQMGEMENLVPNVTLAQEEEAIVVTFSKTDSVLPVGATILGVYPADAKEMKPLDDLRALANYVVESSATKIDLAIQIQAGVASKVSVTVDPVVAKRWLGLEAPEAAAVATCLADVMGTPGSTAKVATVSGKVALRPGDVITGVRLSGGSSFAKVGTWQDLQDFLAASGKPKAVDIRVLHTTGLVDTLTGVATR